MLFIAPIALSQFGQKAEQMRKDGVKAAMIKGLPNKKLQRRPLVLGITLAAVWALVSLAVLLS